MEKLKGSPALIRSGGIAIWDEEERRYWTFIADHQGGSEAAMRLVLWLNALSRPSGGLDAAVDALGRIAELRFPEAGESVDDALDIADKALLDVGLVATPPDSSGELREALQELCSAVADYRKAYEYFGDGSKQAGRCWDIMRRGEMAGRRALLGPEVALATTPEDK